jgi:hypothetical protein
MIPNPLSVVDLSFNKSDRKRDSFMLKGALAKQGFDLWRHCFVATSRTSGKRRSFILEYYCVNPQLREDVPVFARKGTEPSYVCIRAVVLGEDGSTLIRYFPWDEVSTGKEMDLLISAEDCFLSETRTMGRIDVSASDKETDPDEYPDVGKLVWDLKIDKQIAFNLGYGTSGPLRTAEIMNAYWHTEGMKACYSGGIIWNGEEYSVEPDTSYGIADKVWGRAPGDSWGFINCSDLTSKRNGRLTDSAFAFGRGMRIQIGPIDTENETIGGVYLEGDTYEFNFSKVWTLTQNKTQVKQNDNKILFTMIDETPTTRIKIRVLSKKPDMRLVVFDTPSGEKRKVLEGGNGKAEIILERKKISLKNKWEWERVDTLTGDNVYISYMDRKKK